MKGKELEKNERTSKVQYSSGSIYKWDRPLHTRGCIYFQRTSIAGLGWRNWGFM